MNIEEIKWLIKTLKTITENLNNIANIENITDYEFTYDKIFNRIREIENNLDKYKDQDKNAWEELKEDCVLFSRLDELEQKHNIGE